jgi:hypothetical protein
MIETVAEIGLRRNPQIENLGFAVMANPTSISVMA